MSWPGQQGKAMWWTTVNCSHSYCLFTDAKLAVSAIRFCKLDQGFVGLHNWLLLPQGDRERNLNTQSVKSSSSTNIVQNRTPQQQAEKSICTVITIKLNRQCETESSLCARTEDLIFHHYPVPLYYAILIVIIKQQKVTYASAGNEASIFSDKCDVTELIVLSHCF